MAQHAHSLLRLIRKRNQRINTQSLFELDYEGTARPLLVTVCNWSVSGARVKLSEDLGLPETVRLKKRYSDGHSGTELVCRVAWQRGRDAGIQYVRPA